MRFKTILFISFTFFAIKSKTQIKELNPELSKQWLVAIENDTITAVFENYENGTWKNKWKSRY